MPSIVFLLFAGVVLGPLTGLLDPDALLGDLLFPVVSSAVAIILFEGSLTLRREEITDTGPVLRRLLTFGVLITWAIIAAAAHAIGGLSWPLAILFGAILVVTGPTVIGPMLRTIRPTRAVGQLLHWEGIIIDPLGAVLAILVFDLAFGAQAEQPWLDALASLGLIAAVGGLAGAVVGALWGRVLRNHALPDYLENPATLLIVIITFALCEALAHESGLLAVTVLGIWLANMPRVVIEDLLDFKESLTVLLVSALFVLLAARLDLDSLLGLGLPALGVLAVVLFVARPIQIAAVTLGSPLALAERALLAWIAPRGIVAAAIASLFALKLEAAQVPQADLLVPLTFAMIIGTVLWQGLTAPAVAQLLGVQRPKPQGVLFVGSNPAVRALAGKLHEAGIDVCIADNVWGNVREARMAGITTYYGNPVSRHAEHNLDLSGLGQLFAMSLRYDTNTLACVRYGGVFGRGQVYSLATHLARGDDEKHAAAEHLRGHWLFDRDLSIAKLNSLLAQGYELRVTSLTDTFDFERWQEEQPAALALLAWDARRALRVRSADRDFAPLAGDELLYLAPPADDRPESSSGTDR